MTERARLLHEGKWVDVSYSHMMYRIRHDRRDKVLEIRFKNCRHYLYYDVLARTAKSLARSVSPGKYFLRNIDGQYDYEQV